MSQDTPNPIEIVRIAMPTADLGQEELKNINHKPTPSRRSKRQCSNQNSDPKRHKYNGTAPLLSLRSTFPFEALSIPSLPSLHGDNDDADQTSSLPHGDNDDADQKDAFVPPNLRREDHFCYPRDFGSKDKSITSTAYSHDDPQHTNNKIIPQIQHGNVHEDPPLSELNDQWNKENMTIEARVLTLAFPSGNALNPLIQLSSTFNKPSVADGSVINLGDSSDDDVCKNKKVDGRLWVLSFTQRAAKEALDNLEASGMHIRRLRDLSLDESLTAEVRLYCKAELGSLERRYAAYDAEFEKYLNLGKEISRRYLGA
ncbi:hypothetical protein BGZ80_003041 [Entomortierella chlamydospora]|uniref:Uncharacterized protein n=1 Tax=Entomortierella chlamydospora TaxID=101097 RepID=A0A9P6SWX3_9FUNG|nr:hypothetical protein BGZ80_003041 [Entomortierella chlamydospora]